MSVTYDVAQETNLQDAVQVAAAMKRLRQVPDPELRHAVIVGTSGAGGQWRRTGALAQAELDRRKDEALERLSMKTTWLSAGIGVLPTVVGALVGAGISAL